MSGNEQNPQASTTPESIDAAGLAPGTQGFPESVDAVPPNAPPNKPRGKDRPSLKNRPSVRLPEEQVEAYEETLRGRLGLLPKGVRLPARIRRRGWIATIVAGLVAFVTRFWNLTHPRAIVFDETYYVKGAFSLLTKGYEGRWDGDKANELFLKGNYSALLDEADRVVHPPVGKWVMAVGQHLFGTDNGVGWRFSTALLGVLAVMLLTRIAMRMFRSPILAGFAGIAMALDGMGIVMSRTGILDNVLAFFALLAFWAILVDREQHTARLARRVARGKFKDDEYTRSVIASGNFEGRALATVDPWGPGAFARPWLILAGILLGLTCGVKWSGIYAIAAFGLLTFALGAASRKIAGASLWFGGATFRDGIPAFLQLVPTAFLVYIAGWMSWFLNPHSWGRHWAEEARRSGHDLPLPWAPDIINSFVHYHQDMWSFHHSLSDSHTYQSQAWEWIFQARPVNFYWLDEKEAPRTCGSSKCVEAITSIGNVGVWWLAIVGLVVVLIAAVFRADWRAWSILAGYVGLWMPWLLYTNRTIFQFYAVAFLPYVVLALTFGVAVAAQLLGPARLRVHPSGMRFRSRKSWGKAPVHDVQEFAQARVVGSSRPSAARRFADILFDDAPAPNRPPALSGDETMGAPGTVTPPPGPVTPPPGAHLPEQTDNTGEAQAHGNSQPEASEDSTPAPNNAPAFPEGLEMAAATPVDATPFQPAVAAPRTEDASWWTPRKPKISSWIVVGVVTGIIVAAAAFWYPLWTGQTISYSFWRLHMWFSSWI